MFRAFAIIVILAIVGAIGFDYVKENVDIDATIDEVATFVDEKLNDEAVVSTVEPSNSEIEPVDSRQQGQRYEVVQNVEQLTESLLYYLNQYASQFTMEFKGDTSQIEAIMNAAYAEIEKRNPYVYGHLSDRNIEYSYTSKRATLNFTQRYLTNAQQESYVNGKVAAILQKANAHAMSDIDKVKFVNDYIVQHTRYGEATATSPHSAYAVLFEGQGVCQGYALLAYKMLDELGIENLYVTGEVAEGGHAWNLVKLNGSWYHLDTTWNDPLPDRGNSVSYNYFLISDSQLSKDHQWDMAKYPRAPKMY